MQAERDLAGALPVKLDVLSKLAAPYDQLQLGSCTANSTCGAMRHALIVQGFADPSFDFSRLDLYFESRDKEGTAAEDAGAIIRDVVKVANQCGVCPEDLWPYLPQKFAERPPDACYASGRRHRVTSYQRVTQTARALHVALAAGLPIIFGFNVPESFESAEVARTGILGMPKKGEKFVGGHAVLMAGYDSIAKTFLVRNSWGSAWGQNGNFTMPEKFVTDPKLCSDFWVIKDVESAG